MKRRIVQHDPIATMEQDRGAVIIKNSLRLKDIARAVPVAPVPAEADE